VWTSERLVVAVGVDGELAEEFAGGGVDDADVEVVNEFEDLGSGVLGSDEPSRVLCRSYVSCGSVLRTA
jgi:hypothetical protein